MTEPVTPSNEAQQGAPASIHDPLAETFPATLEGRVLFGIAIAFSTFQLVTAAGLADTCRAVSAIAISPAAAQLLGALPFARTVAAERHTRQAVLDAIDRHFGKRDEVRGCSLMPHSFSLLKH